MSRLFLLTVLVGLAVLVPPTASRAVTRNWDAADGAWSDPGNWSPAGAPLAGDVVNIAPTDGVARTIAYDIAAPAIQSLTIDLTGAGTDRSTLELAGPNLTSQRGVIVGSNGRATVNQSAGAVAYTDGAWDAVVGFNAGGDGVYNLSGGQFNVLRGLYVGTFAGSIGQFNHTGGTANVVQTLVLGSLAGSSGTYTLSNSAVVTAKDANIGTGGAGVLNINDDSLVYVNDLVSVGAQGQLNLNGGTLRFRDLSATLFNFNYNSGTLQFAGDRSLDIDATIVGIYAQTAPPASIPVPAGKGLVVEGIARLIDSTKTATINGGTLRSASLELDNGFNGAGNLTVTGGGVVTTLGSARIDDRVGTGLRGGNVSLTGPGSAWNVGGSLSVGLIGRGAVTIQNGASLSVGSTLNITGNSLVTLQGGTLRFNVASGLHRVVYNAGTIQLAGDRNVGVDTAVGSLYGSAPVVPFGKTLRVEGTTTLSTPLRIDGGTFATGGLTLGGGGALVFERGVLELAGGSLTGFTRLNVPTDGELRTYGVQTVRVTGATGSTITAISDLTLGDPAAVNGFYTNGALNTGPNIVVLEDANDVVFDSGALVTVGDGAVFGSLNAANGLTLDFGGNLLGHGVIDTPNTIAKPLINNGHIAGNSPAEPLTLTGYVKGVGTLDNVTITGTLAPGLSPAVVQAGNLSLSPASTLEIEIAGAGYGQFDRIESSGFVAIDGALEVKFLGGFAPNVGDSFGFIYGNGGFGGSFDALTLPTLGAGKAWRLNPGGSTVFLEVVAALPGDYNADGAVDAGDYTVWRDTLGQTGPGLAADGDGDLVVDQDDRNVWATNFGAPAPSLAQAVPESGAALMLSMAALGLQVRRRPILASPAPSPSRSKPDARRRRQRRRLG